MELKKENDFPVYMNWAILFFLAIILASLAFSIRIFNSISIISLVLIVFISSKRKALLLKPFTSPVFLSLLLFFLIQVAGLLYTNDQQIQIKEITQKAGIIAIPFFFMSGVSVPSSRIQQLIGFFSICLCCVSVYCLIHAYAIYNATNNISVFFYHDLLKPFDLHAVFFSWYLFFVILFWLESNVLSKKSTLYKALIILNILFFIFLIILLSSKLVIICLILYGLFFTARALILNKVRFLWLAMFLGILISVLLYIGMSKNPISNRFRDLTSGNDTLFLQNKFSPDVYFNGLQFRLLTWRLTGKILSENKAWLFGVSAGDAQQKLNEQYKLSHVYLGDGKLSTGFLNFNCHNVYLQSLLESGIVGLIILILFIVFLLIQIVKTKNWMTLIYFICMIAFGFSESLLSSQYPIQLFLFLPLLLLVSNYKDQSYLFLRGERYFL